MNWLSRPTAETQDGEFGLDKIEQIARTDPMRARQLLGKEQQRIAEKIEHACKAYDQKLSALALRVRGQNTQTLASQVIQLRQEQAVLSSAVQRLDVTSRDTRELLDEWAEWQQLGQRSRTTQQQEREEMVCSELIVRGALSRPSSKELPLEEMFVSRETRVPEKKSEQPQESLDDLAEWDEIFGSQVMDEVTHWEGVLRNTLQKPATNHAQAADLVRKFRDAHTEQRLRDRASGVRRDRMRVFFVEG